MEYFIDLVLLFFAFSFLGWCIEVTLKYFEFHRFINRGFLTGPWLPIYGSGAALITVVVGGLAPLERGYGTTFALSFVLCGVLEYMTSFVMEKRFHARWWDYSKKPMNLHGRVWIGNLVLFGLAGVGIMHLFNPAIYKFLGMTVGCIVHDLDNGGLCGVAFCFEAREDWRRGQRGRQQRADQSRGAYAAA